MGIEEGYVLEVRGRELAAQLLVFLELTLPSGFDLGNTIDVDRSRSLVTARLSRASSSDIRNLAMAGEAWLLANAPDMATEAAGMSVAIPALTFHRFFLRRVDELIVEVETEGSKLVDLVYGHGEAPGEAA